MKIRTSETPKIAQRFSGFFFNPIAIFWSIAFFAYARLLLQPYSGHYRVFTRAAIAWASGETVYGTDFGTGVGYYFYTPFACLFFYPFACLPESLGLTIFMGLSIAVFFWGQRQFVRRFDLSPWFILVLLPQIYSAIIACKLELLLTGLVLAALSVPLNKRHETPLSGALLATTIGLKFQPLPIAALLGLVWLRQPFFLFSLTTGILASFILPAGISGWQTHREHWQALSQTLSAFSQEAFLSFDNLYVPLHRLTGFPAHYAQAIGMQIVAAATFAITVFRRPSVLMAGALGTAFIVLFSPLQQNNALILWAPLWGALIYRKPTGAEWFLISLVLFGYSDLLPRIWTDSFRAVGLKPLALGLLTLSLIFRQSVRDFRHA